MYGKVTQSSDPSGERASKRACDTWHHYIDPLIVRQWLFQGSYVGVPAHRSSHCAMFVPCTKTRPNEEAGFLLEIYCNYLHEFPVRTVTLGNKPM